jgi:hypothetical protein
MAEVADAFAIGYVMGLIVGEGSFTADSQQPYLDAILLIDKYLPPSRKREQFEAWLVKHGLFSWVKNRKSWEGLKTAAPEPGDST